MGTYDWKLKLLCVVVITVISTTVLHNYYFDIQLTAHSESHVGLNRHKRSVSDNASEPILSNETKLPDTNKTNTNETKNVYPELSSPEPEPEPSSSTSSSTPEPETTSTTTHSEPEPELTTTETTSQENRIPIPASPEPEVFSTPENNFIVIHTGNETLPTPEIHHDSPYAEPVPEWTKAKTAWGPAWEFHLYFIALGFGILAIYSLISIIRLWSKKHLLSQAYFMSLNILMLFIGMMKSLYFFVDGYNSNEIFRPQSLNYFIHTIPFPCITSAFSILFYALLQTTKVQLLPPSIQKKRVLVCVITGHIVLSLTSDIVVGLFTNAKVLLFVCQLYTLAWGIFLFIGYMYISKKLLLAALRKQEDVLKLSTGKLRHPGINPIRKQARLTLSLGVKVTFIAAVMGLLLVILYTFAIVGVYGVFSTAVPSPWPWWTFQFCLQFIQLLMCAMISYVATQPFRYQQRTEKKLCDLFCIAPCISICEGQEFETKEDGIYWNDIHGVSVSYSQSELADGQPRLSPRDETLPLSIEDDAQSKTTQNTDVDINNTSNNAFVLNANILYRQSSNNEQNLNSPDGAHVENEEVFSDPDSVSELPRPQLPMKLKKSSTPVYRPTSSPLNTSSYSPKSLFRNTHFGSWLSPKKPPTGGYRSLEEGQKLSKVNPVRRAFSDVQGRTSKKRRLYSSLTEQGQEGEEFLNGGEGERRTQRPSVTSEGPDIPPGGADLKSENV